MQFQRIEFKKQSENTRKMNQEKKFEKKCRSMLPHVLENKFTRSNSKKRCQCPESIDGSTDLHRNQFF